MIKISAIILDSREKEKLKLMLLPGYDLEEVFNTINKLLGEAYNLGIAEGKRQPSEAAEKLRNDAMKELEKCQTQEKS